MFEIFFTGLLPEYHFTLANEESSSTMSLRDLGECKVLFSQVQARKWEGLKRHVYAQEDSTAKLFATPLHGSPNALIDSSILQLLEPMQAC